MFFSCSMGSADNFLALSFNYYLRFESMSFFLATIVVFLFFWGRSIGLSPTSTITADHSLSFFNSAFFPGKLNFWELINLSSTR